MNKIAWSLILFMREKRMKIPKILKEDEKKLNRELENRNGKGRKDLIKNIYAW